MNGSCRLEYSSEVCLSRSLRLLGVSTLSLLLLVCVSVCLPVCLLCFSLFFCLFVSSCLWSFHLNPLSCLTVSLFSVCLYSVSLFLVTDPPNLSLYLSVSPPLSLSIYIYIYFSPPHFTPFFYIISFHSLSPALSIPARNVTI